MLIANTDIETWFSRCGILTDVMKDRLTKIVAYNEHYIYCKIGNTELDVLAYTIKSGISYVKTLHFHNIIDVKVAKKTLFVLSKNCDEMYQIYHVSLSIIPKLIFQSKYTIDLYCHKGNDCAYVCTQEYEYGILQAISPEGCVTLIEKETHSIFVGDRTLYYTMKDRETYVDESLFRVEGSDYKYITTIGGDIDYVIGDGKYIIFYSEMLTYISEDRQYIGDDDAIRLDHWVLGNCQSYYHYDENANAIYYISRNQELIKYNIIDNVSEVVAKEVRRFIISNGEIKIQTINDTGTKPLGIDVPDINVNRTRMIGFADVDIIT